MAFRRLKDIREDQDMSQKKLGETLGVAQRTYSGYETGSRMIPPETLGRLADLYGTSVDYLMGRTDVRDPYPPAKKRRD